MQSETISEETHFRDSFGRSHRKNQANYAKYGYKGSDRGEAQCRLKCASMGQVTVDHVQSRNYVFADGSSAHFFTKLI